MVLSRWFAVIYIGGKLNDIYSDELAIHGVTKLTGMLKTVEDEWIELYQKDRNKTMYIKIE